MIFISWIGVAAATVIWVLYRLIKGWLALMEGAPTAVCIVTLRHPCA